ncbi:solute carrier family 15 member 1 [Anoplophora glabripennis]|uniref:solute carrier family 15 member 1 n=1 Tax=Anoplophora glabripennis TaxID=217634 RepID=UPI000875902C|nr:solute carrier family 15 member 1 [Anoplophora glabripennis]
MHFGASYRTAVFCIIATEFCERFSFCGLRTILSLYLRNILLFSENASTVIYHVFIMGCYIVPLVGAIFADSYFGRYRTIRNFALIYLVGNVLMCVAAVPSFELPPVTCSALGLILIAIGTGGIKPCVAAFGGEQFHLPDQRELLTHFFSIFYFTINLGGFVGMILTPIMKKAVSCFGDDTCYALGFGFPAALMFLSIFLFIIGKSFYKLKSPKRNIMLQFFKCGTFALARSCKSSRRYDHWLDHARGKFDLKLIQEMKIVCAILLLYTPLPIFWSLFDQQGSRWTFQASHMDGNFLGTQIVPDQMQVVNPAMVLILIPIFDRIFYPCFAKLHVLENSLHRMAFGGIVAGLAFFSAGILELVLETTYPELPDKNHASINVVNTLPCDLTVINPFNGVQTINSSEIFRFKNMVCHNYTRYTIFIEAPLFCGSLRFKRHKFQLDVISVEYQIDTVLIGINSMDEIQAYVTDPVDFQKSISGTPRIRIAYIKSANRLHNVTVTLQNVAGLQDVYFVHDSSDSSLAVSAYMELSQGVYECKIGSNENRHLYERNFHLALGGVYSLIIRENRDRIEFVKLYTMSVPNTVNILWQVPQYFLISVAEIMFGVAGLEFSFTQAPRSMKTVTIAGWYLSVAVGNFLVIIITQLNMFKSQAHEFFLFAILIVADMMLFMEMASNYKFVQVCEASSSCILPEEDDLSIDLYDIEYTTDGST